MGVRKLQKFIEGEASSSVFRKVKIEKLKENYQKKYPGKPIELLIDVDCCLPHLFPDFMVDPLHGGELATVVVYTLEELYQKFNEIGIRLIAYLSNYKPKDKRARWIRKRYTGVDTVNKVLDSVRARVKFPTPVPMINPNNYEVSPSELASTAADVIRFELNETVVHSFTENVIEIITYATKHQTFGILSQDTDFCIANAAQYNFTIENLCLENMTTYIYDSRGLADHLQLQVNQLPLFATLMGNDIMEYDVMKRYQHNMMELGRGEIFVNNTASICRNIACDDNGYPLNKELMVDLSKQIATKTYSCTKVYNLMIDSISSYHNYSVHQDLLVDKLSNQHNHVRLAVTLYRQCWITSDVLMLLCAKEMQMDTCIEMFDAINIKPIGDVLARLRKVLYGAAFKGDQNITIKEYIITGNKCLENGIPSVTPAKLKSVQCLCDVWRKSLVPGPSRIDKVWKPLTNKINLDTRQWVKVPESTEEMRNYFVTMFAQSCDLNLDVIEKLLIVLPGLPHTVHVPFFTFLYLDHQPGAFLSTSERNAILFTFSLVSVLRPAQVAMFILREPDVKGYSSPLPNRKADSVNLIRAANLFMKTTQLIANLNAVCGFPILLKAANGHNYWEGSIVQQFYTYLEENGKHTVDLFNAVCSSLKYTRISQDLLGKSKNKNSALCNFVHVMYCWTAFGLYDEPLRKVTEAMCNEVYYAEEPTS